MPGVLWHFLNINKNLVKASWDNISLLKLAPDIIAFSNETQPPNLLVQAHVLTKVSFSSWIFLTLVLNSTLRDSGRVSSAFLTARCFINSPRGSHLCSVFAGGKNKEGLRNGLSIYPATARRAALSTVSHPEVSGMEASLPRPASFQF